MLWLLGNLSERYDARGAFRVNLINAPDSLGIYREDPPVVYARLNTSGFRFLTGSYARRGLDVDLSRVKKDGNRFYLLRSEMTNILNGKLTQEVDLVSLERDSFFFPVYVKRQKEVPVRADIAFEPAPNYRIDGNLELSPAAVIVEGPAGELEGLDQILTEKVELGRVSSDINQFLAVIPPPDRLNLKLKASTIRAYARVRKFSEAVFDIPVTVKNPPEGYKLRLVPDHVTVMCQAGEERLRRISGLDFKVFAVFPSDTGLIKATESLPLEIGKQPDSVFLIRLMENRVTVIKEKDGPSD